LVAELRDLFVIPDRRRRGIGSALIATLHARLDQLDVRVIEAAGAPDVALHGFLTARGYDVRAGVIFSRARR
jgi:GNAT superfamily N-acetyltransferase